MTDDATVDASGYPDLHDLFLDADADEIDAVVDGENVICMGAMIYALLTRAERAASELERVQAENVRLRDALTTIRAESHHWCTQGQWVDVPTPRHLPCSCGTDRRRALIDSALVASSVVPKEDQT